MSSREAESEALDARIRAKSTLLIDLESCLVEALKSCNDQGNALRERISDVKESGEAIPESMNDQMRHFMVVREFQVAAMTLCSRLRPQLDDMLAKVSAGAGPFTRKARWEIACSEEVKKLEKAVDDLLVSCVSDLGRDLSTPQREDMHDQAMQMMAARLRAR